MSTHSSPGSLRKSQLVDMAATEFNITRIKEIQSKFAKSETLFVPGRCFIREGVLTKICRKGPKKRHFFLFDDILVYGTPIKGNLLSNQVILQLSEMGVSSNCYYAPSVEMEFEAPTAELNTDLAFQVNHTDKSFHVFAAAGGDQENWVRNLTSYIGRSRGSEDGENPVFSPVWLPDVTCTSCMLCNTEFTIIRRKHHCRECGRLVCSACSAHEIDLLSLRTGQGAGQGKLDRVCDRCFVLLQSHRQEGRVSAAIRRAPSTEVRPPRPSKPPGVVNPKKDPPPRPVPYAASRKSFVKEGCEGRTSDSSTSQGVGTTSSSSVLAAARGGGARGSEEEEESDQDSVDSDDNEDFVTSKRSVDSSPPVQPSAGARSTGVAVVGGKSSSSSSLNQEPPPPQQQQQQQQQQQLSSSLSPSSSPSSSVEVEPYPAPVQNPSAASNEKVTPAPRRTIEQKKALFADRLIQIKPPSSSSSSSSSSSGPVAPPRRGKDEGEETGVGGGKRSSSSSSASIEAKEQPETTTAFVSGEGPRAPSPKEKLASPTSKEEPYSSLSSSSSLGNQVPGSDPPVPSPRSVPPVVPAQSVPAAQNGGSGPVKPPPRRKRASKFVSNKEDSEKQESRCQSPTQEVNESPSDEIPQEAVQSAKETAHVVQTPSEVSSDVQINHEDAASAPKPAVDTTQSSRHPDGVQTGGSETEPAPVVDISVTPPQMNDQDSTDLGRHNETDGRHNTDVSDDVADGEETGTQCAQSLSQVSREDESTGNIPSAQTPSPQQQEPLPDLVSETQADDVSPNQTSSVGVSPQSPAGEEDGKRTEAGQLLEPALPPSAGQEREGLNPKGEGLDPEGGGTLTPSPAGETESPRPSPASARKKARGRKNKFT